MAKDHVPERAWGFESPSRHHGIQTPENKAFSGVFLCHPLGKPLKISVNLAHFMAHLGTPTEIRVRIPSQSALIVLLGCRSESPEFEALGDVVQLQDVTA